MTLRSLTSPDRNFLPAIYVNVFIGVADYARSNKIRSAKLAVAKYSPSISTVPAPVTLLRGRGSRVSLFDRRVFGRHNEAAVCVFRRNSRQKYYPRRDGDDPRDAYAVVFPGWESLLSAVGAFGLIRGKRMMSTGPAGAECHFNLQSARSIDMESRTFFSTQAVAVLEVGKAQYGTRRQGRDQVLDATLAQRLLSAGFPVTI